jgi:hypothetical protein
MTAEIAAIQLRLALAAVLETRSELYPMSLDHVRGANAAWWMLSPAIDGIKAAISALDVVCDEEVSP